MIFPPALRPGDAVAVVAPSSPFDRTRLEAGVALLAAAGLSPRFDPGLFARERYLAGSDERRLAELQRAVNDPEVRAIWPARGGYGILRLLPRLDLSRLAAAPKLLVGFSDVTALHAAFGRAGLCTVHGPMVARLADEPEASRARLLRLLTRPEPPPPLEGGHTVVAGAAEGSLLGGNLALLHALAGTPFMPDLRGAILLLEDVGERPYRLDRMWTHLRLAGALDGVAGVVLGSFTDCEEPGADYTAAQVMDELAASLGVPVVTGFDVGHGPVNLAVPLGSRVRIAAGRVEFLQGAVAEARTAA